jgi:hypothetical protein
MYIHYISSVRLQYALLHSDYSNMSLDKVSFDGKTISAGMQASKCIEASTHLLTSCGSMSSDLTSATSISVIESSECQLGPHGHRLLLGPAHVANHNCEPNCQVRIFASVRTLEHIRLTIQHSYAHFLIPMCLCLFHSTKSMLVKWSPCRIQSMGTMVIIADVHCATHLSHRWHQGGHQSSLRFQDQKNQLVEVVAKKRAVFRIVQRMISVLIAWFSLGHLLGRGDVFEQRMGHQYVWSHYDVSNTIPWRHCNVWVYTVG